MKNYRLSATVKDNNGVRVLSNNAETLGDQYGATYSSLEEATAARDAVQSEIDSDFPEWDAQVEVVEA